MACSTKLELLNGWRKGGKYNQHGIVLRSATGGLSCLAHIGHFWGNVAPRHDDWIDADTGEILERKIASGWPTKWSLRSFSQLSLTEATARAYLQTRDTGPT